MKIGYNKVQADKFEADIKTKKKAFQELIDYCSKFNEVADAKEIYKNPFRYIIDLTTNNYKDSYKGAKIEKVFEMIGFSVSHLEAIATSFNRIKYDFDPVTLKHTKPDFNIYAESKEEKELYKACEDICKAVDNLKGFNSSIHYGSLIQSLKGAVIPDFENQSIKPNIDFVKGEGLFRATRR